MVARRAAISPLPAMRGYAPNSYTHPQRVGSDSRRFPAVSSAAPTATPLGHCRLVHGPASYSSGSWTAGDLAAVPHPRATFEFQTGSEFCSPKSRSLRFPCVGADGVELQIGAFVLLPLETISPQPKASEPPPRTQGARSDVYGSPWGSRRVAAGVDSPVATFDVQMGSVL